uniref:Cleavage and polyadenylation specificity factor subunit 2 n=1 Tax=Tetraselmis sp. GSL018 TaxID=582737 RepID=A0A061RWX8_9CHLO
MSFRSASGTSSSTAVGTSASPATSWSLAHLGVLPYAVGKLGLNAPIYGTLPIQKMGSLLMYDQCLSRLHDPSWDLFDLDDVDAVFNNLHTVRFLERTRLTGKCEGITITPHCAGHTLGGAVWCISACGEDIVYAIDYNHRRERHLNGTSLQSAFSRPAAMITGAYNVTATPFDRQARDDKLKDLIISTLRGDGNVLLPVDSAGRALELLLMLDSHWTDRRIVYPLIFMNHQAYNVVEFAKSQLEWMSDALSSKFSRSRDHPNPFETRCLKLMHDTSELAALPPGPVVVVATSPSLEAGLSGAVRQVGAALEELHHLLGEGRPAHGGGHGTGQRQGAAAGAEDRALQEGPARGRGAGCLPGRAGAEASGGEGGGGRDRGRPGAAVCQQKLERCLSGASPSRQPEEAGGCFKGARP